MKARTFILTAGATLALAVPAANASIARNGLYQAQVHTVLAETSQVYVLHGNGMWVRVTKKSDAVKIGSTASQLSADAARALRIRSDALNRKYHLGAYAPRRHQGEA